MACSQNNKMPGKSVSPAPTPPTADELAISKQVQETVLEQTPNGSQDRGEISAELLERYSGVKLQITDKASGKVITTTVPLGEVKKVDGTPMTIEVTQLFPDFIREDTGNATKSLEPNNVAIRVNIAGVSPEFDGILFEKYPEVHPYDNPDYGVVMTELIKKK
ncbi:MAG: hypothetical protein LBV04_08770 [Deferribacteraceae bacterium]|nr:hypothetical protein [Deferribacteraceae bacterium]